MMAINYYPYIRNFFLDDGSDIDSSNDDNNNNNNNSRGGNDGNSSSRNHINIDEKGYSSNFIYAHHRKHLPANYKRQPSKSTQKATTYAAYENSFNNLNRAKDDFRTILTTYQGMINHLTKNYVSIDNEAPDNNGRAPGTVTEQFVASQNELIEGIRGVRIAKEGNAKTLQALIQRLKGSTTTSDVGSSKSSLILPADISISENEPSYARLSSSPPMDNTFSGNVSSNADPGPPTPVKICTLKRDAFTVESTLAASSMDNAAPKDDLSVQPAKPAPVTSPISPKNCNSTGKVSSNIPEANSTFVATFANNSFGHYSTCCPVPFRDPGGPSKPPIYPIKTSVYNGALDSDSEYEYSEIEEQYEGKGKGRATVPQWTKRKKVKAAKELLLTTAIGGCGIKFYPNS
ncbi:hypothetical protein BD408DRAFT_410455 [Parasitella parasitica]|nr:hypothetical protein BD408DRAFT_410455 [Parasitella parasitica]